MLGFFCRGPVIVLSLIFPQIAGAHILMESYVAQIGPEDRVNSKGAPIADAEYILTQDRANIHRFGIQHSSDTKDIFSTSQSNRAKMAELIKKGRISPLALDHILSGRGASVLVGIFGRNGVAEYIWVLSDTEAQLNKPNNSNRPDQKVSVAQVPNAATAVPQFVETPKTLPNQPSIAIVQNQTVPILPGAVSHPSSLPVTTQASRDNSTTNLIDAAEDTNGHFSAKVGVYTMRTLQGGSNWCAPHIAIRADYPKDIRPEYINKNGARYPNWDAPPEVSDFAASMKNLCPEFRSLLVNHNVGQLGKSYVTNAQRTIHSMLDGFSAYSRYQQFETQIPKEDPNQCDILAAFVNDPDKPIGVLGVQDGEFQASDEALEACINAVLAEPEVRRHRAHLGRVLMFRGDFESAAEEFQTGKSMGSGTSMLYLGTLKAEGWGVRADLGAGNFEWRLGSHYGKTPFSSVEAISISTKTIRATCEKSGPTHCSDYRDHRRANAKKVTVKDGKIIYPEEN